MELTDYNPFAAKVQATTNEIERLEEHRAELVGEVTWAAHFDPETQAAEIARIRSDLEERTAELGKLEERISELDAGSRLLASQTAALVKGTRLGLNVLRWFTTEHNEAKVRLRAHERELDRLRDRRQVVESQRDQAAHEVAGLTDRLSDSEQALTRFRRFRSAPVEDEIAKIDGELPLLQKERGDLMARKANVDRALAAPLIELQEYGLEIKKSGSIISRLRAEISGLEDQIGEAEHLDHEISRASNGYERAKLHQESERRFGNGSPRAAIRELRSELRPLQGKIRDHERQMARAQRDTAKIERRIKKLASVAARDIRALIVDGNNCCYEGSDFIGLAALIPMTRQLAKRSDVTVVFDAAIRGLLGVRDDELRRALPAAKVHVVASHVKADETILDAADDPTVWVISNDRFGDYRDKTPVKERRVIRHEIVGGRVLVHDLGVNELLAESSISRAT